MKALALLLVLMMPFAAVSQESKAIGSALLEEVQDAPSKTYSVTMEIWSIDRDADQISVTLKAEGEGLTVLSKRRIWKNMAQGKRQKYKAVVKNTSKETRPLQILITRKSENRTDTKTISVLVPPQ